MAKNGQAVQKTISSRILDSLEGERFVRHERVKRKKAYIDRLEGDVVHFGLKKGYIGCGVVRGESFSAHRMGMMIESCHSAKRWA